MRRQKPPVPVRSERYSSPEDDILHVKGVFDDTRGWHSDSEDILQVR